METIVDALAEFTSGVRFEDLPLKVVEESKRLLIDSIGCALGGLSHSKGSIAIDYARMHHGQRRPGCAGKHHRRGRTGVHRGSRLRQR